MMSAGGLPDARGHEHGWPRSASLVLEVQRTIAAPPRLAAQRLCSGRLPAEERFGSNKSWNFPMPTERPVA